MGTENNLENILQYKDLISAAVGAMANARPRRSGLPVGASVFDGHKTWAAGNVEVLWQKCYHAEECAILSAIAGGCGKLTMVCVAAERRLFTPCGACSDLILEFGGPECLVVHYNPATKVSNGFSAKELMPFYPTRD